MAEVIGMPVHNTARRIGRGTAVALDRIERYNERLGSHVVKGGSSKLNSIAAERSRDWGRLRRGQLLEK